MADVVFNLEKFPAHLGLGAKVGKLPEFDGTSSWYEQYGAAHAADGNDGRLVSMYTFTEPWTTVRPR